MSGWFRAIFLYTSFAPLYLLLAASLYVQSLPHWPFALIAFVAACGAFKWLTTRLTRKSVYHAKVTFESSLDESVFAYLLSYIPPLMIDNFSDPKKLVPVIGFYFVAAFLLFRSNVIYINPFFLAFGYRIYIGRLHESGRTVVIVTRRSVTPNGEAIGLYEVQTSRLYYAV
jgi:hypothetical protein